MGDRLIGADKAGPELHARRPHLQIRQHRLAASNPAGNKDRHVAELRQDFLGQHARRHRSDVPARLATLNDDPIDLHADELACYAESRREAQNAGFTLFDSAHCGAARETARQYDMTHPMLGADVDQVEELRVEGDQVDAKGTTSQRLGRANLGREQLRRHRSRSDDAEPPGIGNSCDQVALRNPGHRSAHDGEVAAEQLEAVRP